MISPELLQILRCPETHQKLVPLLPAQIGEINTHIRAGKLKNRRGDVVSQNVDGGLVREDGKSFFPIRQNIPVLLIDEAIAINLQPTR